MDRWSELERLGKLRADGLLSDAEFEEQKRRLLQSGDAPAAPPAVEATDAGESAQKGPPWSLIGLGAGALVVAVLLFLLFRQPSPADGNAANADPVSNEMAAPDPANTPGTFGLRSDLAAASFVRLDTLPTVTPYGDNADDYCGEPVRARTAGGRAAEQRGWRVVKEERFQRLDAVLIVRGFDPGTSSHCYSKDANLAFFRDDQLIGVVYSKSKNPFGMNNITIVGDRLRVWDDLSAVGQVTLVGNDLVFDRVTGSDEVCGGSYRVPAVFGEPYSKARRMLANSGWIPVPSTEDAGVDERLTNYRRQFPEADSCSGTGYGYCGFSFRAQSGSATLSITTAGEDDDPSVTDYGVSCDGQADR